MRASFCCCFCGKRKGGFKVSHSENSATDWCDYCHHELYRSQYHVAEPRVPDLSACFSHAAELSGPWETWRYGSPISLWELSWESNEARNIRALWKDISGGTSTSTPSSGAQLKGSLTKHACLLQVLQSGDNLHMTLVQEVPLVPSSYWVLRGSAYSFPLVRSSRLLSAGVLHALLCLKVYSWCIHRERFTPCPPTLPSCSRLYFLLQSSYAGIGPFLKIGLFNFSYWLLEILYKF